MKYQGHIKITDDADREVVIPLSVLGPATSITGGSRVEYLDGRPALNTKKTPAQIQALIDAAVGAGTAAPVATKTGAYTVSDDDYTLLCDATGGAFTVTLPPANRRPNRILCLKKIDSSVNAVTVDGDGAETIDGGATKSLATQWTTMLIQTNGANWYVLAAGATA